MFCTYADATKPELAAGRPTVRKVEVYWIADDSADVSYLDTDPTDENYAEDKARLVDYHNGEWRMEAVRAAAEVTYPIGAGCHRIQTFSSCGLWGIESDSDKEYKRHEEVGQLLELKEHLEVFGVDTTGFWKQAGVTAEDMREYENQVRACVSPAPVIAW